MMQLTDRYKYDPDKRVALVEKFFSTQGEGRNAGRAAFFIRMAGCNLDCQFADGAICDTPWRSANEKTTVGEVEKWVHRILGDYVQANDSGLETAYMVILTGGEPTMVPAFDDLVYMFKSEDFYVAVETNGTIWRDSLRDVDWVVVSPKHDIKHGRPLHKPSDYTVGGAVGGLDNRVVRLPPHEYRFVIAGPDDKCPVWLPANQHYLSPALEADGSGMEAKLGITPRFVKGAVKRCIEIVQADPRWRISLQTHKWIQVR